MTRTVVFFVWGVFGLVDQIDKKFRRRSESQFRRHLRRREIWGLLSHFFFIFECKLSNFMVVHQRMCSNVWSHWNWAELRWAKMDCLVSARRLVLHTYYNRLSLRNIFWSIQKKLSDRFLCTDSWNVKTFSRWILITEFRWRNEFAKQNKKQKNLRKKWTDLWLKAELYYE